MNLSLVRGDIAADETLGNLQFGAERGGVHKGLKCKAGFT